MTGNINNTPDYENLAVLQRNRLSPRAYFIPAASLDEAKNTKLAKNRELSSRMRMLSGRWDFRYYSSVFEVPEDIHLDAGGYYDRVDVPSCWQSLGYGVNTYLNIRYQFPAMPPYVPNDNPVGVYKRRFTLSNIQAGELCRIVFCGVSSAFHVYCNGLLVGYSQSSHNMSEFDLTPYVHTGENDICVLVYQFCDGSYLETQDFYRYSGIFRDVYLLFMHHTHIEDILVDTEPVNAELSVFDLKITLAVSGSDDVELQAILYKENIVVNKQKLEYDRENTIKINAPQLWSAEIPELYDLFVILYQNGREIEAVYQPVGFKHIEIKNGVFFLNNQNIKLKGVNRHDSHYKNGHTVTLDEMEQDIKICKEYNVNCIRASHYPNDPRFLELCDRYGIYLIDEMDLETHGATWMHNQEYFDENPELEGSGEEWKYNWSYFSENPEWESAFIDRVSAMVLRDRNHACVTMWSLGNESGFIRNHQKCYEYIKTIDPKIPVHYEGAIYSERKGFDVVSMMYPDFEVMREHLKNLDEPPFFLCEYCPGQAHTPGGMEEHWEIIYENDKAVGGCIWQFADHSAVVYNSSGAVQYKYGYGGDFEEGIHDNIRAANGFFSPERQPRNAALIMKQVYRPIRTKLLAASPFTLRLQNMQDFSKTDGVRCRYEVIENGIVTAFGEINLPLMEPHDSAEITLAEINIMDTAESFFNIFYMDCNTGKEIGFEQLKMNDAAYMHDMPKAIENLEIKETALTAEISADDLTVIFDKRYGTIKSIVKNNVELLCRNPVNAGSFSEFSRPVAGPQLCFWRVPDFSDAEKQAHTWRDYGYDCLETHVFSAVVAQLGGKVIFTVEAIYGAKAKRPLFKGKITYTVHENGTIDIAYTVSPNRTGLPSYARVGIVMDLCADFDRVEYYGNGPFESFSDAKESVRLGLFNQSVNEMSKVKIQPQLMGNRTEVRYSRFVAKDTVLTVCGQSPYNMSASHYSDAQIERASHMEDLKEEELTRIHLDSIMAPIGRFYCGYPDDDKRFLDFPNGNHEFKFTLIIGKDA